MERPSVRTSIFLLFGVMCFTPTTEGRQMCLSCQYQTGVADSFLPCLNDPWNWGGGNVRMRCNFLCTLEFRYDTKQQLFTYAGRSCSTSNDHSNECFEVDDVIYCYKFCGGEDYCNEWNVTDVTADYINSSQQLLPFAVLVVLLPIFILFA